VSRTRLIILAIAVIAGVVAAILFQRPKQPPTVTTQRMAEPTVSVLVAAAEIRVGDRVESSSMRWINWPAADVPDGVIRKDKAPAAEQELARQLARETILTGDPIRRERLIATDGTGFLAAVLPAGKRATAIAIDKRGTSTAGGFIMPGDRVDVVRTRQVEDDNQPSENHVSETILRNVRVLAIGQNVRERNGDSVIIGDTATLELSPTEVEIIARAQRGGTLTLALRSLQDASGSTDPALGKSLTLVRYGVTTRVSP
jgi:pilus assembly protein CpaB